MTALRWIDRATEGAALGINRGESIAHAGWQIGAGGYAANGVTTQAAAALPANTMRLFSTSLGVVAMCVSAGTMKIHISADGIAAYSEKLSTAAGRMHGCLQLVIDCGSGRLVIVEYGDDTIPDSPWNNTPRIWYTANSGTTWSTLITAASGALRHFHGGIYDSTYNRLYIYTGDDTFRNSVLWCDDVSTGVDSLAQNPTLWSTRWGLDDATRSTLDTDWVVGTGSVTYRTIAALLVGDYLYFGVDSNGYRQGVQISRMHRSTRVVEKVFVRWHDANIGDTGNAFGELWTAGLGNDGSGLIASIARPVADYWGDTKAHVYRIEANGNYLTELMTIPLTGATYAIPYGIHAVGDFTVIPSYASTFTSRVGTINRPIPSASVMSHALLRPKKRPSIKRVSRICQQNMYPILLESGGYLLGEAAGNLLMEDGGRILCENDNRILLELEE